MTTETDNKNTEGTEENKDPKEHHSWIEEIVEDIQKLDTEFPLSGAETEEEFETAIDDEEENKPVKTSFKDDLETEFPLSGGEVER